MNYPLISEYIQAIKLSEENFDKLTNLRPVFDTDGNPVMSSGNFAVVFKMLDKQTGKFYAVKCFLREQEGREESYKLIASELEYISSAFLTRIKYFEKELFVDTTQGNDTEFPVLLMDWVEGFTLDKYIRNNIHDQYKLSLITYQFCRMASWLLSQDFAHGDLKPDNIIVREDGQLVLVDYDGMFVPAMKGQKARELGSVDYRHPFRAEDKFDSTIDDFSIASIALSLKAISLRPELFNKFGAEDRLLFSSKDYQNIGDSECTKAVHLLSNDVELAQILGLFYVSYARNELSSVSFRLLNIERPKQMLTYNQDIFLSTKVTEEDLAEAVEDECGVKYSKDGLRLLRGNMNLVNYTVREGTVIICDDAFNFISEIDTNPLLTNIHFPQSLIKIGKKAFWGCLLLSEVYLPPMLKFINDYAFGGCQSLSKILLPQSIIRIGCGAFVGCSFTKIVLPKNLLYISEATFNSCFSLKSVILPDKIENIENDSFRFCKSIERISIPESVKHLGRCCFSNCLSLKLIELPSSLQKIDDFAFYKCISLLFIKIPKGTYAKFVKLLTESKNDKYVNKLYEV